MVKSAVSNQMRKIRDKPRVHIIVIEGEDWEPRRKFSIPLHADGLHKTFVEAQRQCPKLLDGYVRHIVVILGSEVMQYNLPNFKWLCGIAAPADAKDPDWMG